MDKSKGMQIVNRIREVMAAKQVHALIIPSADPHMSEYVAPRYLRRGFVSNFHGSAGTAVITASEAKLWTDGRYWLEAGESLYPGWDLMKDGLVTTKSYAAWLSETLSKADNGKLGRVGVDPFTITIDGWNTMAKELPLVALDENVVDSVWKTEGMPSLSDSQVFLLPEKFSGVSVAEKLKLVREDLAEKKKCDFVLLSALDDVAWITNLRGSDVECNPVFYAYVLISQTQALLFIDVAKVSETVAAELKVSGFTIVPYQALGETLRSAEFAGKKASIDDKQISHGIKLMIDDAKIETKFDTACVKRLKALKNKVELEGFYNSHARDGAALTMFLAWLEKEILAGATLTEVDAADRLEQFRREREHFVQLSFTTIAGSGPNGAIIHYRPEKSKCRTLSKDEMFLLDSGAQYWDGTTDVTRTMVFHAGAATEFQRRCFTAVLKGHIAINSCVLPKTNVTGHRIDCLARHALWQMGLDYQHGTGHGVGHFLNVHEGPHGIGVRPIPNNPPLEAGMIVSNEPGYYKDGEFGIRIENLETIVEKDTEFGGAKSSLGFDTLTMAPLCPYLIDVRHLSEDELSWVNSYHEKVRKVLLPLIPAEPPFYREYLERNTASLVRQ